MDNIMRIECKHCEAYVVATVAGSYVGGYGDEYGYTEEKYSLLECPRCHSPMLASQQEGGESSWLQPVRLYPDDKRVNPSLPEPIRNTYREALDCFNKAKAYSAAALMCRKVLEGLCAAQGIKAHDLASSLKEMKDKGIIENRLFEWAEALRLAGNQAAHDFDVAISRQDAEDILDFTNALVEYVLTFRDKFNEFIKRRQQRDSIQKGAH